MNWSGVTSVLEKLQIPQGYTLEQLKPSEILKLINGIKKWYPDIVVGAVACYLQEDFYKSQVYFEGETEKDIIVILLKYDSEPVGMISLERDLDNLTLYGGLGVLAPEHRGEKLAYIAPQCLESVARTMKLELIYYIATLRSPHMQAVAEASGFQLAGIIPGSDRAMIAPGVVKRVYEALYVKVLVPQTELLRPKPEYLTPTTKALLEDLFPE